MQSPETDPASGALDTEIPLTEIQRAAGLVFRAGDVVEVRVPKARRQRTISGYFSDCQKLTRAVSRLDRNGWPGIYWTINPVNHPVNQRWKRGPKESSNPSRSRDSDSIQRLDHRHLPVETLPIRPPFLLC